MFYEEPERNSPFLRLGDIINGFHYISPSFPNFQNDPKSFVVDYLNTDYFVVLTPCCSIDEGSISIVPLKKLWSKLFDNPYFVEDFTVINRPMLPEKMVPASVWDNLPLAEKEKRLGKGINYSNNNIFIYKFHDYLPEYELIKDVKNKKETIVTGYYYINFKDITTIKAPKISLRSPFIKILQLNINTRGNLRTKLSHYFARVPDEDLANQ